MTKPSNDEYARLMESSAQLMESLRVSVGQVQEILFKMAALFRGMPSSEIYASMEAKMGELREMGIGENENDVGP
jgi:hypothetical protein